MVLETYVLVASVRVDDQLETVVRRVGFQVRCGGPEVVADVLGLLDDGVQWDDVG